MTPEGLRLEPCGQGACHLVGEITASVAAALANGTWSRLEGCRADTCAEPSTTTPARVRASGARWVSVTTAASRHGGGSVSPRSSTEALRATVSPRKWAYNLGQNGEVERLNRTLATEWAYRRVFNCNDARDAALASWLQH